MSMETDISNSFSLQAMQIVGVRAHFRRSPGNCDALILTMQELAAANAGRLRST